MSAPHGDAAVAPRAFIKLPDPPSSPWAFTDASSRSFLRKWDLEKHARVARFRYTKPFHRMDADEFVRDFFDSDVVNEHFHVLDRTARWRSVREIVRDASSRDEPDERDDADADADADPNLTKNKIVEKASYAKTPCAVTSMSLFDRLRDRHAAPEDHASWRLRRFSAEDRGSNRRVRRGGQPAFLSNRRVRRKPRNFVFGDGEG
jgi:hypothetical protein